MLNRTEWLSNSMSSSNWYDTWCGSYRIRKGWYTFSPDPGLVDKMSVLFEQEAATRRTCLHSVPVKNLLAVWNRKEQAIYSAPWQNFKMSKPTNNNIYSMCDSGGHTSWYSPVLQNSGSVLRFSFSFLQEETDALRKISMSSTNNSLQITPD